MQVGSPINGIDIAAPPARTIADIGNASPGRESISRCSDNGDSIERDASNSAEPLLDQERVEVLDSGESTEARELPEGAELAESSESAADEESVQVQTTRVTALKGDQEREAEQNEADGDETDEEEQRRKTRLAAAIHKRQAEGSLRRFPRRSHARTPTLVLLESMVALSLADRLSL